MAQPVGATGWIPVILIIILTGGAIAAIVLIPVTLDGEQIGGCNNTVLPLNLTGMFNSTFTCTGVDMNGPFNEGPSARQIIIEHNVVEGLVQATDGTTSYQGYVPAGANLRGSRELSLLAGHPIDFEIGRFEVFRRCTANQATEVSLMIMGERVVTGEICPARRRSVCENKFSKTCTEKLVRVSVDIPPGTFTEAPTPAP